MKHIVVRKEYYWSRAYATSIYWHQSCLKYEERYFGIFMAPRFRVVAFCASKQHGSCGSLFLDRASVSETCYLQDVLLASLTEIYVPVQRTDNSKSVVFHIYTKVTNTLESVSYRTHTRNRPNKGCEHANLTKSYLVHVFHSPLYITAPPCARFEP